MIFLRKIRLINWYAFNQITAPIGDFTLIAGENGNGKSVLLDAIKYGLYGDTVFNKSTDNKGSRTISSYTRGLLDATAGSYMRPADKIPNVYTHIVLEMYEEETNRTFILGTVIETNAGNNASTQRYVIEGRLISEIEHTYQSPEGIFVYSASELQKKYNLKMMSVNEGLARFMQRIGLRLNDQQLIAFRRKLRSIMSYDPNAKIDQFIRDSVLEEKKVDFSKLMETKKNIDTLTRTFEAIDKEIEELNKIISLFKELKSAKNVIFADDVKKAYQKYLHFKGQSEEALKKIDIATRLQKSDKDRLENLHIEEAKTRDLWNNSKDALSSMDCAKAIAQTKSILEDAENQKQDLLLQKEELSAFQDRINRLMIWMFDEKQEVTTKDVISSLTSDLFSSAQKESGVSRFLSQLKDYRDNLIGEKALREKESKDNQREQLTCNKVIEDYNAKKTTFSEIPDYLVLKREINSEFEKRGIKSEARFACEYVIGLSDENWRDVIEGYLGRRRYTILVEPQYYDIADEVFNASKNKFAHLFNTKLLMKKEVKILEDSVVQFIDVKNPIAKKYFEYQLGRFHATTIDCVKNFENAMSREGRVTVAMDSYFIQFNKTRFYCLGQETLELNKLKMQKHLDKLKKEEAMLREMIKILTEKKTYLDTQIELFGSYNYNALKGYEEAVNLCNRAKLELQELIDAQKDNVEYMSLAQRVVQFEKELETISKVIKSTQEDENKQRIEILMGEKSQEEAKCGIDSAKKELKEYEIQNFELCQKAKEDYDKHLASGKMQKGGILKDRSRAERALSEAGKNLRGAQASYNTTREEMNRLPMSEDSLGDYQSRHDKIWMDDREEIQIKLKEQTRRYEEIFKNEFVLTIWKSCEAAKNDLKLINAELSKLSFKSLYEFDVKYVRDGSDYEKILEYARYLKERENLGLKNNQLILDSMTSFSSEKAEELDREIKKIINRIVESNEWNKIENYADYRHYMTYEILLTNEILSKAKLSKQSGYNSGAEVQIPYMIILLSSLLMVYNDKLSSTRIVFIDEPFAKMDPTNVRIMMGFMREQRLQMIFCAPDKTELIGNECEVILPVLRTKSDLMEAGMVEMRKGVKY